MPYHNFNQPESPESILNQLNQNLIHESEFWKQYSDSFAASITGVVQHWYVTTVGSEIVVA